jgi:hypothetical protein
MKSSCRDASECHNHRSGPLNGSRVVHVKNMIRHKEIEISHVTPAGPTITGMVKPNTQAAITAASDCQEERT